MVMGILCDWDLALDTENPPKEKKILIEKPQNSEAAKGEIGRAHV